MPWYRRVHATLERVLDLAPTQTTNLALLVSAILARRCLCLSELARALPTPEHRRVQAPKHDLLHRLKRLWRFVDNPRIDPVAVQAALVAPTIARLGNPRWLGLVIDWTMFNTRLPGGGATQGRRVRWMVLRIAVPRRGRALPLLQLAADRDHLPHPGWQGRLEERALGAVLDALPAGVRPVVVGDRGFGNARTIGWLQARRVDYVLRIDAGVCITNPDGTRCKTGQERLARGQVRIAHGVRYGLTPGKRPRDLHINLVMAWRLPKGRQRRCRLPDQPWYLATSLGDAHRAVAWYWQRGWIEQSFKDSKSRCFGLDKARLATPKRLDRLLMALTIAMCWLCLLGLPELGCLPAGWHAHVAQRGRASLLTLALALLDELRDLPPACLPQPTGGYG
jgi:hypothetical protein